MDISYLGHSSFKLKGKKVSVVTDPFANSIGLTMPKVSADIVTLSHEHDDHNAFEKVTGTARREEPYVVRAPGEYEVQGVGVFGWGAYHDDKKGEERGKNTMYVIHIEGVRVAHLGDLGHELDTKTLEDLGEIDVAMIPVGGIYTLDTEKAVAVAGQLQAAYVIPMHFKTSDHDIKMFGELSEVDVFMKAMGVEDMQPEDKLSVTAGSIPEEVQVKLLSS